jgi:hypothetical protein
MSTDTAVTVGINDFARRHTAESKFSHYEGDIEDVARQAAENFANARPVEGRPGVFLVSVPPKGYFSGVVRPTPETELRTTFEARRDGEEPFVQTVAVNVKKTPARYVDVCLYSRHALGTADIYEYEVVSINASLADGEEPATPLAMARNFLNKEGGSQATYTAEQFAEAIWYWSQRVMSG